MKVFDSAPDDFADRIRAMRGNLTQTELAARLGVNFVTVNRWENNRNLPTRLAWRKILEFEARRKKSKRKRRERRR